MSDIETIERIKKAAKSDIRFLARQILGFADVNLYTHGEIIECLASDITRKLICVPRGCLKSSLACVAYPIWLLINNTDLRILVDSELYTNSMTFLREIKGHLDSPLMRLMFGNFRGDVWNESEIIIRQRKVFKKEASITVGGIGTTKVGQHYDVIISDDMNSPNNTNTPNNAQKVIDHYKYNMSILEPEGTYVVIGTRYSELDIIGHILHTELGIQDQPKSGIYDIQGAA